MNSSPELDRSFVARSHPARRAIVGRLEPRPIEKAASRIERHRALWEAKFDAVERYLAEPE